MAQINASLSSVRLLIVEIISDFWFITDPLALELCSQQRRWYLPALRCFVSLVASFHSLEEIILTFEHRIEPALFVYAKEANPIGGYNKLCNPPPALGARGGAKRDEVVISSSLTNALPVTDNCTESQVKPAESWTNYAPDQDTLTTHGRYTVSCIFQPSNSFHITRVKLGFSSLATMTTLTCVVHVLTCLN